MWFFWTLIPRWMMMIHSGLAMLPVRHGDSVGHRTQQHHTTRCPYHLHPLRHSIQGASRRPTDHTAHTEAAVEDDDVRSRHPGADRLRPTTTTTTTTISTWWMNDDTPRRIRDLARLFLRRTRTIPLKSIAPSRPPGARCRPPDTTTAHHLFEKGARFSFTTQNKTDTLLNFTSLTCCFAEWPSGHVEQRAWFARFHQQASWAAHWWAASVLPGLCVWWVCSDQHGIIKFHTPALIHEHKV